MTVSKDIFFGLQQEMDTVAFNQTSQWFASCSDSLRSSARFYVDSENNPRICCFGFVTKFYVWKKLIIEGLSYKSDISLKEFQAFFKELRATMFEMITISDVETYNPDFEIGIRRAGFIRPLGLSLCPMSLMVDLTAPPAFHRNWRRNVSKSKEYGNKFQVVKNPSKRDAEDFADLFLELKDRKSLSFSPSADEIMPLFKGNYKLFFILNPDGRRIAGRVEFENDKLIYDTYAANSFEAINTGAAYHIQESIFDFYREAGALKFDYGRISPCDGQMDAIYMAKSYSGGFPVAYNGQWIYCSSVWMNYLYSFYIHCVHKSPLF